MFELLVDPEPNVVKSKCTPCNTVTNHVWTKITPVDTEYLLEPLDELALVRRLIMCTECGNLSLKK